MENILEFLKALAPYFASLTAIVIAVYNNRGNAKTIERVDSELQDLKKNHFFHLGEYLKKLNAFLFRGKLFDDVQKVEIDILADGVAGKR